MKLSYTVPIVRFRSALILFGFLSSFCSITASVHSQIVDAERSNEGNRTITMFQTGSNNHGSPWFDFPQDISGVWTTASSEGFTFRAGLTSSVVNGKIYVMGGRGTLSNALNTLEVFDPSWNTWSTPVTTGTFTPRAFLTSSVVNGKIYAIGGESDSGDFLNTLEVFDPLTNEWSTPPTTGTFTARAGLTSCVVDGMIYVMGGLDGTGYPFTALNVLEVFDPSTNAWSTPVTTGTFSPRAYLTSSAVGGKIYVMAGYNNGFLNTFEVFDPSTNTWSTPAATGPFARRAYLTSSVVGDKIYALGGFDSSECLNTFEVFDPSTNVWSTPPTTGIFTARAASTSNVVLGQICVMGGLNRSNIALNTNEIFLPSLNVKNTDANIQDIEVFPNPTNGPITVYNAPANTLSVAVENTLGISLIEHKNPLTSNFILDLSKLASGTYFIRFATSNSIITRKVILQQ